MKIEIEFDSSHEAAVTIDGRKMRYSVKAVDGWAWREGVTPEELETTIGGILAGKVSQILPEILQGWMPSDESPDGDAWETWEKLSDEMSDEMLTFLS
jgi:hypothetical protein